MDAANLALIFFLGAVGGGVLKLWFRRNRLRRRAMVWVQEHDETILNGESSLKLALICLIISMISYLVIRFLRPFTVGVSGALLFTDLRMVRAEVAASLGYIFGVAASLLLASKTIGRATGVLASYWGRRSKIALRAVVGMVGGISALIGLIQVNDGLAIVGLVLVVQARASPKVVDFLSVLKLVLSESTSAFLKRRRKNHD